ncbi:MAG: IS21 family transposase [Syntrophomonadaceae bacterium]|nr:IS21 family transposase [Syntrophomonadaceae bacterium]MDD4412029.1 IS21 family transposase [Bacilli bacterium]
MITLLEKQQIIISHYHDGKSQRKIEKETGISRKTIRKYIKQYEKAKQNLLISDDPSNGELIQNIIEKPKYNSTNRKKVKLTEELMARIEFFVEENRIKRAEGKAKQQKKKIDIYEELINEGFDISYPSVCNAVRGLYQKNKEAYIKQEYQLGEQCEFDWGDVKLKIAGKNRILQMSVLASAKGNYRYSKLFYNQKTESFLEAHSQFFENIQGVYHTMVYDNMKVAVKRFVGPTEKEPTEALLKLSLYYGFKFRFCNTCAGWEKGHVERSVEYVRRKAFSRRDEFASLEEAQEYLDSVVNALNQKSQAHKADKSALEILNEERPYLLPAMPQYDAARIQEPRVDKYSTICVDNCHYSVPDVYVGEFIFTKIYTSQIHCYHNGEKIAQHERKYGHNEWSIKIEHYLRTLKKKPGALAGSTALQQAEPELQKIYHNYYTGKEKEFIQLLELIGEKGLLAVTNAITLLQRVSPTDISTEKITAICNRNSATEPNKSVKTITDIETKSRDILKSYGLLLISAGEEFEEVSIA